MLPLSVIIGEDVFREEVDITSAEFYEKVRGMESLPTSSQPTTGEIVSLLERLSKEYDAVISIHLSSKISGTYQNVSVLCING